jgi:hypothetical protein
VVAVAEVEVIRYWIAALFAIALGLACVAFGAVHTRPLVIGAGIPLALLGGFLVAYLGLAR